MSMSGDPGHPDWKRDPDGPRATPERRERVAKLWAKHCRPHTPSSLFPFGATEEQFDDFAAALDAEADARVREAKDAMWQSGVAHRRTFEAEIAELKQEITKADARVEAMREELMAHFDRQIEHVKQNSAALRKLVGDNHDEPRSRELAGLYLQEIRMMFAGWPEKPVPPPSPNPAVEAMREAIKRKVVERADLASSESARGALWNLAADIAALSIEGSPT